MAGISGAVVVSVFASDLIGTFVLPRTVPATAVILSEPPTARLSRQSAPNLQKACPRPVIDVGAILNAKSQQISPLVTKLSKISERISSVTSPISALKSRAYKTLGIECLFPKLIRPFQPIFKYTRCRLGLTNDGFMNTPSCDASTCVNATVEIKEITRDKGLPNLDFMMEGRVNTMDDCFADMDKVIYGARVVAKLVDDQPCDDPKYESMCQEAIEQKRMILEDNCETSRYVQI